MQIKTLFTRWIDTLASLIEASQALIQARKSVVVTEDNGCFTIRRSDASDGSAIGTFIKGSKIPSSIAEHLRKQPIIFEIAAEKVVTRHLTVPIQAQEFLPGIVRNQIERLSPWPPAQAVYGIDAKPNPSDAGTLNVSVPIASRASIDAICGELAESGLAPSQVALRPDADIKSPRLTLWTRPVQGAPAFRMNLPHMIGAGLAAMVVLSAAVSLYAIYSTSTISGEHDEVAERTAALQRQSHSSQKLQDIALLKPPQRAWALKENSPVAVLTLEALSQALPDTAYLTELQLENTTLRIIGLAADAPSLIAALEQSGRFSAVHFFAPTTKSQTNALYKFFIETHVEEHPSLADHDDAGSNQSNIVSVIDTPGLERDVAAKSPRAFSLPAIGD